MKDLNDGGVLVVGCGRMGGALLDGWIAQGLRPASLWIEDPHPGDRLLALAAQGAHVNAPGLRGPRSCCWRSSRR